MTWFSTELVQKFRHVEDNQRWLEMCLQLQPRDQIAVKTEKGTSGHEHN